MSPTPEAYRFYKTVEGIFLGTDHRNELAQSIRTTPGGTVSIGVIPSLSTVEVPNAIHSLCEAQIDVKVQTYLRNTPAIVDAEQLQ